MQLQHRQMFPSQILMSTASLLGFVNLYKIHEWSFGLIELN